MDPLSQFRDRRGGAGVVETVEGKKLKSKCVKLYEGFLSMETPDLWSYAENKWKEDTGFSTITLCLPYGQVKCIKLGVIC